MKINKNNVARLSAGLGAVAGMRTTIAPAVLSHYLSHNPKKSLAKSKLGFMQSSTAAVVTKILTAAEIVADKLPAAPNRIIFSQTLPRVLSGAFVGAVVYKAGKQSSVEGILIGGASALAATYASFYIRKLLGKIPLVKDPLLGVIEDVVAVRSASSMMKS
ncbi:hypothetical protein D770_02945 [Flammeovirgaceae bacterium 311]|nr:hypothetical protein D770_02945 [Flammeovirgaceae bacterium 311]